MRTQIKHILRLAVGLLIASVLASSPLPAQTWPISRSSANFADTATSPFGIRYKSSLIIYDHHEGIDLRAFYVPVSTTESAIVEEIHLDDGASGNWVLLRHRNSSSMSMYLHLDSLYSIIVEGVFLGDQTRFATSGTSGTNAPHLHYGYIGNTIGIGGPRVNPISQLPFSDVYCPDLYETTVPTITYDAVTGNIDFVEITTSVHANELDFAHFRVWLYKPDGNKLASIYTDDASVRNDNNADDVEFHGNFTFNAGDPDYELRIECRPRSYTTFEPFHIIDWKIDPLNNLIFPDLNYIGIAVDDLLKGFDCFDFPQANWGNVSGESPKLVLSNFRAEYDGEQAIIIRWAGAPEAHIRGVHFYRTTDTTKSYRRVTNTALPVGGVNNVFSDTINALEEVYFYKYGLEYDDGRIAVSDEYAMIEVLVPRVFDLSQNYPNPFNPFTVIEYALPAEDAGHVTLRVVNILGREVRVLIDETQPAGSYKVTWDGLNGDGKPVGSGVYLYQLITQRRTQSKRMVLVK